jgi:hypothetical protein
LYSRVCFIKSTTGCQFGIQLYDWDGSTLIFNYNFIENGIGIDDRQVTGAMAKG